MANLSFRTLKASEIDCRISTVNEKGISLLLYKDARVDQTLLDETVGPMNWQRSHSRDNANCTVSIWDDEKKQWISKEDVGTESNTEKEKGLASDSFKRACFNWGIGRELYSAPFIWISNSQCNIQDSGRKNQGKPVYTCYDKFYVDTIGYDDERNITRLIIKNAKDQKTVFNYSKRPPMPEIAEPMKPEAMNQTPESPEPVPVNKNSTKTAQPAKKNATTPVQPAPIDTAKVNAIYYELKRTGIGLKSFLKRYGKSDVSELNFDEWKDGMNRLKAKPDKAKPANDVIGFPINKPE